MTLVDLSFILCVCWNKSISKPFLSLCASFSSLISCSQRNRCERADEPYRFAASLNQCVKATVYPDSIAVSEPSVPVSLHSHITLLSAHTNTQSTYETAAISTTTCTHYNKKLAPIYIFPTHVQRQKNFNDPTYCSSLPGLDCGWCINIRWEGS